MYCPAAWVCSVFSDGEESDAPSTLPSPSEPRIQTVVGANLTSSPFASTRLSFCPTVVPLVLWVRGPSVPVRPPMGTSHSIFR